jgi:hypothetical protein
VAAASPASTLPSKSPKSVGRSRSLGAPSSPKGTGAGAGGSRSSSQEPGDSPRRQEFIAATVAYSHDRDEARCTPAERAVLQHVRETYAIPDDFEVNKARYGPLSGSDYAARVLINFGAGTLPLRPGKARVPMCAQCAGTGHFRPDCPTLLG